MLVSGLSLGLTKFGGVALTVAPTILTNPTIIAGPQGVGDTLIVNDAEFYGIPTPGLSRQWQKSSNGSTGWTPISGAASLSYVIQQSDVGFYLRYAVTGTNSVGSTTATTGSTSIVTGPSNSPPVNTELPIISGNIIAGYTLSSSNGTWNGIPAPSFSYQWQRSNNGSTGWTPISGAISNTYTLQLEDLAKYLRCVVTGSNSVGTSSANSLPLGPISDSYDLVYVGDQLNFNDESLIFNGTIVVGTYDLGFDGEVIQYNGETLVYDAV